MVLSVGVLEGKSLSSRILEDNFEVLGLGLESRVLGLGLVTQVLGKTGGHTLYQSLHVLHKRLRGNNLEFCPLPITE